MSGLIQEPREIGSVNGTANALWLSCQGLQPRLGGGIRSSPRLDSGKQPIHTRQVILKSACSQLDTSLCKLAVWQAARECTSPIAYLACSAFGFDAPAIVPHKPQAAWRGRIFALNQTHADNGITATQLYRVKQTTP